MRQIAPLALLGVLASAPVAAQDFYLALRLQSADQQLADATLTSPRVDERISSPGHDTDLNGAIAVGYGFAGGWRLEAEYSLRKHSQFDSYWAPFDANVNRMQVNAQRLMLNGYKDFAITDKVSVYAMAGIGLAQIDAEGYQSNPGRRFASHTQNNLAYSLGLGVDYALSERLTLGSGYRYVNMGKVETGHNTFVNRANARDEQLKGRLSEQNLFVEARLAF